SKMLESETIKLLRMEDELHKRVVGQDEAINAIANAIRRNRAGISPEHRPIGTFMFLGPTGVGKTELAKTLSKFLFNSEKAMVRIDMSEFMERHTVSKLVGAPPGYVGYEEGGQLTEAVRRKPYSVILFDEIEKAHPDVFNILLQIMEDGRLTDGQGRTVDFANSVIIMTSNIASEQIFKDDSNDEVSRPILMKALQTHFRPEFLNRLDEIIIFHTLTEDDLVKILNIQINDLQERLSQQGIELDISDKAKKYLTKHGFDQHYGVRPLKRLIQREVENKIAIEILKGIPQKHDEVQNSNRILRIFVDIKNERIFILQK
ncbi:MAG: AAA family ATPase, partial [Candidatus Cloacimonetes bacterium]|nr:AAA family ATPase [Candidatus Cloacimonadota bacterium]